MGQEDQLKVGCIGRKQGQTDRDIRCNVACTSGRIVPLLQRCPRISVERVAMDMDAQHLPPNLQATRERDQRLVHLPSGPVSESGCP
jgi:hypothetical protein